MKKYIVLALSLSSSLHCMEQQIITREAREWNAKAYEEGNDLQTAAFLHFLQINKIKTEKRIILDGGCGTAKLTAQLAKDAHSIHGFDASKNMIEFAQKKYGSVKNLSLEHCFAEDFQSQKRYQLVLMSFCFHWIKDKKMALQRINDSLENDGEFFANIVTSNNPVPLNLIVYQEMKRDIPIIGQYLSQSNDPIGSSYPSTDDLHAMLHETGFDIIKSEEQSFEYPMTVEEFKKLQLPIVESRPGVQYLPSLLFEPLFNAFINRCLEKLPKTDDGKFVEKVTTTIVHARKTNK